MTLDEMRIKYGSIIRHSKELVSIGPERIVLGKAVFWCAVCPQEKDKWGNCRVYLICQQTSTSDHGAYGSGVVTHEMIEQTRFAWDCANEETLLWGGNTDNVC